MRARATPMDSKRATSSTSGTHTVSKKLHTARASPRKRSQRRSLLLITHDVEEAVSLSDRVIVLTHRPARIRAIHEINIDVDRTDMMAARESPYFTEYIRSIWSELEVQRRT